MGMKGKLLSLFQHAYEQEQAFVSRLSDEERSAVGAPDRWSAKDLMAHIAAWKERLVQNLEAVAQGRAPVRYQDFDRINAEDFKVHRDLPWTEVLAWSERVHAALMERIQAMSEDDLLDTGVFPWQEDRPLWRLVAGTEYIHPILHLAQYYTERGDVPRATELQEEAADRLAQLDDSPTWQGVVRYNLACHYSLSGQKEKAIQGLREALRLNPDLTEWSKEDPDFAPIRQEPEYQALYAEPDN